MRRLSALALAGLLVVVSTASADIALPRDQQQVDPKFRFEGLDKNAGHIFFLRYLTFAGNPVGVKHRVVEIKDDKAFPLNAQRRLSDLSLLALDRVEYEKLSKGATTPITIDDKTPGVLMAKIETPTTVFPAALKDIPVNAYRLSVKDGKLIAEKIAGKTGDATPFNPAPLWLFGILGAVSVTWFGVWFARRK